MKLKYKAWLTFLWERFPPITHIPFTILFLAAHHTLSNRLMNTSFSLSNILNLRIIALLVATFVFFFMLRLYDEIKDFETDKIIHPDRPLVRKLLSRTDLHNAITVCILLEVIIFSFFGINTLITIGIVIVYSLLMFKEFFIRDWIRKHLTFYAITHTFVSCLFSLTLFSAFTLHPAWNLSQGIYLFVLVNWFLFNIYEFGRKTFATPEERKKVDSYTKVFGRFGAVMLVLSMAVLTSIMLVQSVSFISFIESLILLILLTFLGIKFAFSNKEYWGKLYRVSTLTYIGLIYLSIII